MAVNAKKLFYKIGEVCRLCDIEPHVLRYWETEFALLAPTKNRAGQRIYRQKDLQMIEAIKYLLYEEGYTIAGANRKLIEDGTADLPLFANAPKVEAKRTIREIKRELQDILQMLE